ncbi:MAG: hypothetical protein J6W67_00480, partial [Lentisphaeria bacterium]|nr:hypothetical protein [Lentisphaeria bacterium]
MQQVFTVGEVPELTAGQQIIYVDFDGELTSYNSEILTVDSVEVSKSGLSTERIESIISSLNSRYADTNVKFVAEKPYGKEYSTVFVGMTDAFSQYGDFAGLSETVDIGNQNKTDNAFVLLDSSYSDEEIISIISHENDHLTGSLSHAGNGISKYAAEYYYNQTYTGNLTSRLRLFKNEYSYVKRDNGDNTAYYYYSNAQNIRVIEGGNLRVESGAVVNLAEIYADGVIVTSNGSLI